MARTYGGAVSLTAGTSNEPPFKVKKNFYTEEKMRIAEAACKYIKQGETILLDSGTTVLGMVKHLASEKNIMVATNDLIIATELAKNSEIDLTVIGGGLRKHFYTLIGFFTQMMLKEIHVDKLFLGVDAVDLKHGFMNYSVEEVPIKKLMIEAAKEVIVLCDHSKFESIAFLNICPINRVNRIITGKEINPEILNSIKEMDIEIETV